MTDEPLFSDEELTLIQRVRQSDLWLLLANAMRDRREALFQTNPESTRDLWAAHGAMRELSNWLETGPILVVQYHRLRTKEKNDGE